MASTDLLSELYAALQEPIGRGIPCAPEDADRLRQQLYKVRRESGNPEFSSLSFRIAPDSMGVWITKEKKDGSPDQGADE